MRSRAGGRAAPRQMRAMRAMRGRQGSREPPMGAVATPSRLVRNLATGVWETVQEARSHVSPAERDTMVLLSTAALTTPIFAKLNLSPVLGFLFAGMALGPNGFGIVSDVATTTKLAEFGVVFFLFEMGLELELERLKSVGKDAFSLGTGQFLLTSAALALFARLFGLSANAAVVLGGGLALSSSAFVIQLLSEKGELATRFGRASFGILLLQDLAVVPLLVVTPLLAGSGAQLGAALRLAAIKSASALVILFAMGRYVLQYLYKVVASAKDKTAFLAITLLTVLSLSAFTQALGLSDTLGAFLAGVLLAETKYRYQIEADIAPFRGLLLGLFFVTTGFAIDLPLAIAKRGTVLGLTAGVLGLKTLLTVLVCVGNGLKLPVALRSGLLLSQGGEFAFVIFALAQTHGILPAAQVKLLYTVVVATMFLTPFLNELGASAAQMLESARGQMALDSRDETGDGGSFVLVCGFGRVGQAICELLTHRLVRYKAFDMDPYRVAEARGKGLPVFYGDARRPDVLQAFMDGEEKNIEAVVVTLDNERDCTRAVRALRRLYPTASEMPIFVRAVDKRHARLLQTSGATALETGPQYSSLMLGGAILSSLGMPTLEVLSMIDEMRATLFKEQVAVIEDVQQAKGPLAIARTVVEKITPKVDEAIDTKADAETDDDDDVMRSNVVVVS